MEKKGGNVQGFHGMFVLFEDDSAIYKLRC